MITQIKEEVLADPRKDPSALLPARLRLRPRKRGRRRDRIVAWCRHICNNKLHLVGLTCRGSLVFPDHTFEELVLAQVLGEFGDQSCKCAKLFKAWISGKLDDVVPEHFMVRRPVWGSPGRTTTDEDYISHTARVLAHRIQKRRKRLCRRRESPVHIPRGAGDIYDHISTAWLLEHISTLLKERGYKEVTARPDYGYLEYRSQPHLLRVRRMGGNESYIAFEIYGLPGRNTVSIKEDSAWWGSHELCDMIECCQLKNQLAKHQRMMLDVTKANGIVAKDAKWPVWENKAGDKAEFIKVSMYNDLAANYKVTLEVPNLTLQAAQLVYEALADRCGDKLLTIYRHNTTRLRARVRIPAIPHTGIAAKRGKKEDKRFL